MLMYIVGYFFLGFMFFYSNWGMMFLFWIFMCSFLLLEMNFELVDIHMYNYFFGVDLLSMMLIFLSSFVCMLMISASSVVIKNFSGKLFVFLVISLCLLLIMVFSVVNILSFYLMFEAVLIPTYLLVLGWGYQPERLNAGLYLMFYTLFASLPLLLLVLYLVDSLNFSILFFDEYLAKYNSYIMCLLGFTAFLVKVPMFFLHLWLPKAHVEAPIAGSMILAGILLKMGGYGLIRFLTIFYSSISLFKNSFMSISLVGCVIISLICLRQIDIKSLIAYSSVVHMGLMLCGIFSDNYLGLNGSFVIMIGHGLCSSGLFYLANVYYYRINSRSLLLSKGLMMIFPNFALIWFLLTSSNMAAPPSLNLLGEIDLFGALLAWSKMSVILLVFISFLSGAYSLYLYASIQHGKMCSMMGLNEMYKLDYLVSFLHWVPLNLLFLKGSLYMM